MGEQFKSPWVADGSETDVSCAAGADIERARSIYAVAVNRHPDAKPGPPEYRYPFNKVG